MNTEQIETLKKISNAFKVFKASEGEIRPHFILTGPSGSGKSYNVLQLCDDNKLNFIEINAAQLTKEGLSGNSLSKALAPLAAFSNQPAVCFVDEFDKLFISGNNNCALAHETTNGVQNEFLKVLEASKATVAGDYGKYVDIPVKKVLFIFAGAFNGEENITIDRLREFGIKTEFIGRVGLVYNLQKLSVEDMHAILDKSSLFDTYLKLFPSAVKEEASAKIKEFITSSYENNTLGARLVNTLIHQYFIKGGKLGFEEAKQVSFQKPLEF